LIHECLATKAALLKIHPLYDIIYMTKINQSFINNKRANWPLTMLYKNIKSTIKHSDTQ